MYAVRIWKGDIMVADMEELETMDASEIYSKKRVNAKEVLFAQRKWKIYFPVEDGRIKLLGDQDLRTSTSIRQRPIRGESQRDFIGESEGSLPLPQDSLPDAGEARNDFGLLFRKFHIPPSR